MRRRDLLNTLVSVVMVPSPVRAAGERPTVAILDTGVPQQFAAFRDGMKALGYVEGETVTYAHRSTAQAVDTVQAITRELVARSPQVIVTAGPRAVQSLKDATTTVPIVFIVGDAVAIGAVESLARPGGNITGLSYLNIELSAKRLEVLAEALPNTRRVVIVRDANSPDEWWRAGIERAGKALGIEVRLVEVFDMPELERAIDFAPSDRPDAIDVVGSPMFNHRRARLAELVAGQRIPAIFEQREYVESGGLLSYGPDLLDLFRRAAVYVHKVLRGAKPGDLPVEQPTKFELVINGRTAKGLGLAIPPTLLARADEVIE